MLNEPVRAPVAVGVKPTSKVQESLTAMLDVQVVL
jgi:hypothetical protein